LKPKQRTISLQLKVSLLILAPMILVLVMSSSIGYVQQRERSLASMSLLASQTGRVIENMLMRDMLVSDFERIQDTFNALGEDERIETLYLLDTTGRVVFAPDGERVDQRLSNRDETCQPCHRLATAERPSGIVVSGRDGQPVFRSMHPIENRPECTRCHDPQQRLIGLLLTDLSIAPIEAALASELRGNLAWWIGTVVVTTALANLAVNRWLLRRLRRLAAAISDFGHIGSAGRLPENPADEISRLSAAFNSMADRVQKRELQVKELSKALRQKAEERGELLERLLAAQEDERKRVAQELHDELGQGLSSMALSVEIAQRMAERDPKTAAKHLDQTRALIAEASDRMYDLILGLRPSALDDLGLVAALQAHAKRTLEPAGTVFEIETQGLAGRLPPQVETVLFRIFQEALTNILRHAKARHVVLRLARKDGAVEGEIHDDGIGFEQDALGSDAGKGRGLGLSGMRERAAYCGGEVEIKSRLGEGTAVRVRIPIHEVADA